MPINGTFVDEGAKWTDNMDGEGIVYANEQLDTSKVGPQTLTYSYTDQAGNKSNTVTRVVTVVGKRDTYVLTPPSRLNYFVNDALDLTGAEIKVTDTRGNVTYVEPTPEMFAGFSTSKPGTFTLRFTYGTGVALYRYTVTDVIERIAEVVPPTKTTYQYGEELDLTGGKLKLEMRSGEIREIDLTADMVSGYDSTPECAVTKLMFLLGHGLSNKDIRYKMNSCLIGEITKP